MFVRPCFLVVDHEFAGSISTRKLVLETAKFNVITAYSYSEAKETIQRFPNVDACVVSASGDGMAEDLLKAIHRSHPKMKRVMTGGSRAPDLPLDLYVETYSPSALLDGLLRLFPDEAATVNSHERELEEHIPTTEPSPKP